MGKIHRYLLDKIFLLKLVNPLNTALDLELDADMNLGPHCSVRGSESQDILWVGPDMTKFCGSK